MLIRLELSHQEAHVHGHACRTYVLESRDIDAYTCACTCLALHLGTEKPATEKRLVMPGHPVHAKHASTQHGQQGKMPSVHQHAAGHTARTIEVSGPKLANTPVAKNDWREGSQSVGRFFEALSEISVLLTTSDPPLRKKNVYPSMWSSVQSAHALIMTLQLHKMFVSMHMPQVKADANADTMQLQCM